MTRTASGNAPLRLDEDVNPRRTRNEGPSVFVMCAYFLGLASIVVVVIGGHFPWFTLAPMAVLLMVAHVRRLEAKFKLDSASQLLHPQPH